MKKVKRYNSTGQKQTKMSRWIANDIQKNQYPLEKIVILFLANHQSNRFEEAFTGIPLYRYRRYRFLCEKEIKDIIAYLRLLTNESDDNYLTENY